MAFQTRLASLFGFFTTTYHVGNGETYKHTPLGGKTKQLRLAENETNVSIEDRGGIGATILKRLFFDIGDVTVSTPAARQTYERMFLAGAFTAAVDAELDKMRKLSSETTKRQNLANAELEDYVIIIPPLPTSLFNLVNQIKFASPSHEYNEDQLVEEGQIICRLSGQKDGVNVNNLGSLRTIINWNHGKNTTNIKAPVSGKIMASLPLSNIDCDWSTRVGQPVAKYRKGDFGFYVIMQPVKGSDIRNSTFKAYEDIITWIESVIRDELKLNGLELDESSKRLIQKDLEMLKRHQSPKGDVRTAATGYGFKPVDNTSYPQNDV